MGMNLKECYEAFNGDYNDVMNRLPKEASVSKFLKKFATMEDFSKMMAAVEAQDYETVFATSHNLKGMAANLSISAFCTSVSAVCESVRGGSPSDDFEILVKKAESDYEMTLSAIEKLDD